MLRGQVLGGRVLWRRELRRRVLRDRVLRGRQLRGLLLGVASAFGAGVGRVALRQSLGLGRRVGVERLHGRRPPPVGLHAVLGAGAVAALPRGGAAPRRSVPVEARVAVVRALGHGRHAGSARRRLFPSEK